MATSEDETEKINNFLQAASNGNLNLLKQLAAELDNAEGLLSTFTRVRDEDGRTALHLAAADGKTPVCDYLIKHVKLDINVKADNGTSPLHLAVLTEQLPMTVYLIENGADVRLKASKGCTPLHCAAERGNTQILKLLISHGAEIDVVSDCGTPLQLAVAEGMREAVKFLLDHNANPNKVASCLYTPLISSMISTYLDISEMLLKAGADPNLSTSGSTPLGYAASRGMTKIVKCLLEAGADPNAIDTSGLSPLECAAMHGDREIVKILFPLTSRVQYFPDWSIRGIMKHINSKEARAQIEIKSKEALQLSKSKGNEAFEKKDYINAIIWYAEAKSVTPDDATLYSNTSLCWAILDEGTYALTEALECARLRPNWPKAHYRIGVAWKILKNYSMATASFFEALKLDPMNKEIESAFHEAAKLDSAEEKLDSVED